jgi:RecA/RadA recombinase
VKKAQYTTSGMSAIQKHLLAKNRLQSLDRDEPIPVMPTGCPPLDWVTDCGGIPRGRVVQIAGPESSGKCLTLNTFIPVKDKGILTLGEMIQHLPWLKDDQGNTLSDQTLPLEEAVISANSEPTPTVAAYYCGLTPIHHLYTEDGHNLSGRPEHRVLVLPDNGILRWTHLSECRPGYVIVTSTGQQVSGPRTEINGLDLPLDSRLPTERELAAAYLLGALATTEVRDNERFCLFTTLSQYNNIINWARTLTGDTQAAPFDDSRKKFTRFSGLAPLRPGRWTELAEFATNQAPDLMRTTSLEAQKAWCAALTISRGTWTQGDLEIELQSTLTAKILQLLLENLGIRTTSYPTLDTFSSPRQKVTIRDRIAQQNAKATIWNRLALPRDWKDCVSPEMPETHPFVTETLRRAREIVLRETSKQLIPVLGFENSQAYLPESDIRAFGIDTEDTDKDNLLLTAQAIERLCRTKSDRRIYETLLLLGAPNTGLDRVTHTKPGEPQPTADVHVPIGHHYSSNGLVSHNSTTAMHLARVEMERNPDAVCVFMDYERAMAVPYARRMGLHKYRTSAGQERFHLIPVDMFEEADELLKVYIANGVFPAYWILDSVPAMVPQAMFEMEEGDNPQVALQARKLAELLGRWVKIAADYGITFVFLNQIRAYIKMGFGDPGAKQTPGVAGSDKETSPGGNALRFYSSLTIDLRPKSVIKGRVFNPYTGETEDIPVANIVKATAKKNKVGSPYRSGVFHIQFGEGIDVPRTVFDLAIRRNIIVKTGRGFSMSLNDSLNTQVTGSSLEDFLSQIKYGPNSTEAMQHLQTSLQWDRAAQVHSQILGLSVEDTETGATTSRSMEMTGDAASGILGLVRSQTSLVLQADALNLFTRSGRAYVWKNPNDGTELRAGNLESMEKKVKDQHRSALQSQVDARIKEMEDAVAAAQAPSSPPATPSQAPILAQPTITNPEPPPPSVDLEAYFTESPPPEQIEAAISGNLEVTPPETHLPS